MSERMLTPMFQRMGERSRKSLRGCWKGCLGGCRYAFAEEVRLKGFCLEIGGVLCVPLRAGSEQFNVS